MSRRRNLGTIEVYEDDSDALMFHQRWNPSRMCRVQRQIVADLLIELANEMLQDRFQENGGEFAFHKAPLPKAKDEA